MLKLGMKPDPTHATRPRAGKKLDAAERARFLEALAATGNFALAAQTIGRTKNGLYKRRAREPLFAAQCAAALATFNSSPPSGGDDSGGWRARAYRNLEREAGTEGNTKTPPGALRYVPGKGARPPQLRRAPAGSLSAHGEEEFLLALSATGNVRLAAASVGVAPSSIHRKRKNDPDFGKRFDEALAIAKAALEALIMERCMRTFDLEERDQLRQAGELGENDHISTTEAIRFLHWLGRKGRW